MFPDEEIESIRLNLALWCQELAQIDERVRELSVQRDQLPAYVHSHKALISHPRRLPPDIVREISVACLPTSRNAVMCAQEAPLLLCRICSAWRGIALSTLRLWASLHIPFDFIVSKEPRMAAVVQWLERSVACLSAVAPDENWEWDSLNVQTAQVLMDSLAEFSARWREVEFRHLSFRMAYYGLGGNKAPMLESFKSTGSISWLHDLKFFHGPNLRTIALHSCHGQELDQFVLMPLVWDQLENLTLECDGGSGFSFRNLMVILGRCTRLVHLRVTPAEGEADEGANFVSISLSFLKTFIVPTSHHFSPELFALSSSMCQCHSCAS